MFFFSFLTKQLTNGQSCDFFPFYAICHRIFVLTALTSLYSSLNAVCIIIKVVLVYFLFVLQQSSTLFVFGDAFFSPIGSNYKSTKRDQKQLLTVIFLSLAFQKLVCNFSTLIDVFALESSLWRKNWIKFQ